MRKKTNNKKSNITFTRRLKKALKEADDIISGKTYAKGYTNIESLEKALLSNKK